MADTTVPERRGWTRSELDALSWHLPPDDLVVPVETEPEIWTTSRMWLVVTGAVRKAE
ncbi:MAG TPA: hypothetical protein VJ301_08040 [Propionibacteriaceae bacterium]|nr:hypothetical protein [Propionibacteriaceae bacterium]